MHRLRTLSRTNSDAGGIVTSFLIAILVLVGLGVAAFFYFGGRADVKIKQPDIKVNSTSTPG